MISKQYIEYKPKDLDSIYNKNINGIVLNNFKLDEEEKHIYIENENNWFDYMILQDQYKNYKCICDKLQFTFNKQININELMDKYI